ncbi:hypothetical protein FIU95_04970 [Microbulbifer sp. THAF38]|nr:hypothetical protein FIU95_04970 [Microbulbifer sp. THAF38]
MPYTNFIRSLVVFCLVVTAYLTGEHRGLKRGIEISVVLIQSGCSADQAKMITLLLGFSRRGEEENVSMG